MKTISVLYLAMILPSGFASTGFDFLTGMLTEFLSTEPVTEKIIVDGAVGSGRFFTLDSVNVMSLKMDAANSSSCCQECWNTYPETQLVNFQDNFCECLKTKVGKQPTTQKVGRVSGMCGSWNYQGQGDLGDQHYFEEGSVDWQGSVNKVDDSEACCTECHKKLPGTALVEFVKERHLCHCYNTKLGKNPLLLETDQSSTICVAAKTQKNSENKTSSAAETEPIHVTSPADVEARLGEEAVLVCRTSIDLKFCSFKSPGGKLFTMDPALQYKRITYHGDNPLRDCGLKISEVEEEDNGVWKCEITLVREDGLAVQEFREAQVMVLRTPQSIDTGSVSEPLVSVDNKHVAEALTITTPKPELCDGGFSCCPDPTDGDNTLGTEQFIQESQYKSDFKSCADACRKLYPFSNGVTQSKTQTYGSNKKPFCWCEFGQYKLQASTGYQTCLFKDEAVEDDDYEY